MLQGEEECKKQNKEAGKQGRMFVVLSTTSSHFSLFARNGVKNSQLTFILIFYIACSL